MNNDIPSEYNCPEKEKFLDQDDYLKGHDFFVQKSDCIKYYTLGHCEGSCGQKFLDDSILYLFDSIADKFGFVPFEKKSELIKKGTKTSTIKSVVGFYHDLNRSAVFIHWKTNEALLPDRIRENLGKVSKIDHLYEGIDHLLVKKGKEISVFDINSFNKIKEIISSIDYEYPFSIDSLQIDSSGTIFCFIMDDGSKFLISGIIGIEDFIEIERIRLTEKLNTANPFFSFEPFKKVDWSTLKDDKGKHFESLCEIILGQQKSIVDIQPIGKTNASDRGRDFIVLEEIVTLSGKNEMSWLVQCKYSKDSISPRTIPDWTNRVLEHGLDGYWLITNNDLTPNLFDQIKGVNKNNKVNIETRIWQRNKFDMLYNIHPELFTKDNFE